MTREVPEAVTAGLRAELDQLLASRPDITGPALAAHTTLADATIRSFRTREGHAGEVVCAELRRVLDQIKSGEILQPGSNGSNGNGAHYISDTEPPRARRVRQVENFYMTQTAKRVGEVMDYCADNSAIGVIAADFGAGKTEAAGAWRKTHAGKIDSIVLEFDQFVSHNVVDFVCVLGSHFGLQNATGGTANGGRLFRELVAALRKAPCLLIFDQCERVSIRILDLIRQLWDRTKDAGVGVVLLSAPILLARMHQSRVSDLGALTSRVGIWAVLSGVNRAEMAQIVKQEGFAEVDDAAFDLWWKATGGSMRRLMRALDLLKAKHTGKRITEKTIAGVAGHLWGMTLDVV